jgi:hypothetical protein
VLDRMGRKDAELRGGPDCDDAVIVPATDLKTRPDALDIAACKRDRAQMCADCPDQSWRIPAAVRHKTGQLP